MLWSSNGAEMAIATQRFSPRSSTRPWLLASAVARVLSACDEKLAAADELGTVALTGGASLAALRAQYGERRAEELLLQAKDASDGSCAEDFVDVIEHLARSSGGFEQIVALLSGAVDADFGVSDMSCDACCVGC